MKAALRIVFLFLPELLAAQTPKAFTVHFAFDKAILSKNAMATLDSAIAYGHSTALDSIVIQGHCDPQGTDGYNDTLSKRRAQIVESYLTVAGRFTSGISIRQYAYGEKKLISTDDALNRRTEIVIFGKPPQAVTVRDTGFVIEDLKNLKEGEKIILHNINFYGGTHYFLPSSDSVLHRLIDVLQKNPSIEIEIQGYVCCTPEGHDGFDQETFTMDLSYQRALAIYKILVANGVDPKRLTYKGYGGIKLVEENSEADRIINRRVEIKIVKK